MKKSKAAKIINGVKLEKDILQGIPVKTGEEINPFKAWTTARIVMYNKAYKYAKKFKVEDDGQEGVELCLKLRYETLKSYKPSDCPKFPKDMSTSKIYDATKEEAYNEIHALVIKYLNN